MSAKETEPVRRIALRPEEVAASLGISRDTFDREIAHELRCVRIGRLKLYGVSEIEKWVERNSARALESER